MKHKLAGLVVWVWAGWVLAAPQMQAGQWQIKQVMTMVKAPQGMPKQPPRTVTLAQCLKTEDQRSPEAVLAQMDQQMKQHQCVIKDKKLGENSLSYVVSCPQMEQKAQLRFDPKQFNGAIDMTMKGQPPMQMHIELQGQYIGACPPAKAK